VFNHPDELDLARTYNPHLAFGHGVHHCLGAPLARMELQVALAALTSRLPDLRLAVPPAEIPWRSDRLVRGVRALPVTWGPPRWWPGPPARIPATTLRHSTDRGHPNWPIGTSPGSEPLGAVSANPLAAGRGHATRTTRRSRPGSTRRPDDLRHNVVAR
jgi:hypothetical protein